MHPLNVFFLSHSFTHKRLQEPVDTAAGIEQWL